MNSKRNSGYTYVSNSVSQQQMEKWTRQRRKKDGIETLPNGFSFKAHGRGGFIYYREGEKVLELYWEMSGVPEYDILLNTFGLRTWIWPQSSPVNNADYARLRDQLVLWLQQVGYRAQLSDTPY